MIVVFHNGAQLLEKKIRNFRELELSGGEHELILFSDGSNDGSLALAREFVGHNICVLCSDEQRGKYNGLNVAAREARGEILVFSDLDAIVDMDGVNHLLQRFQVPDVGGVCGQRVIGKDGDCFVSGQKRYIGLDSWIKFQESKFGSTTSNDGKLYAVRRSLFRPVDPCATDDLYTSLNIVEQGYRFVYEPDARAVIRVPSRSPGHELVRRRRVVTRSLHGISVMRRVLDPSKYGLYAIGLFVNKVMRRFLPIFIAGVFLGSMGLALKSFWGSCFFLLQCLFYGTGFGYLALSRSGMRLLPGKVASLASAISYFCVGLYGTGLGLYDFFRGKRVTTWTPVKGDEAG